MYEYIYIQRKCPILLQLLEIKMNKMSFSDCYYLFKFFMLQVQLEKNYE